MNANMTPVIVVLTTLGFIDAAGSAQTAPAAAGAAAAPVRASGGDIKMDESVPATGAAATMQANADTGPPAADDFIAAQADDQVRAEELIGVSVVNADNESVATISDLLLDHDGNIVGVVLSVGGLFGVGAKPIAVPWVEITIDSHQQLAFYDLTDDAVNLAPTFKSAARNESAQKAGQPPESDVPLPND